jgi:hypothetical protein
MYDYNARWYDPAQGRFTTEDPIRDGQNWYAYCGNNPMVRVDPTGLEGQTTTVTTHGNSDGSVTTTTVVEEKGKKTSTSVTTVNTDEGETKRTTVIEVSGDGTVESPFVEKIEMQVENDAYSLTIKIMSSIYIDAETGNSV